MSSQTFGVGRNSEQRIPHRAEQQIIYQLGFCNAIGDSSRGKVNTT